MAWVVMVWYEMESGGMGVSLEGWIKRWMGLDGVGVGWNGMGVGWGGIGMVLVLSWRARKISVNRLSSVDARVRFTCVYRTCAFRSPASDQDLPASIAGVNMGEVVTFRWCFRSIICVYMRFYQKSHSSKQPCK